MTKIQFSQPLANSSEFPTAFIQGLPTFNIKSLKINQQNNPIFNGNHTFTLTGRNGLAIVAEHLKLNTSKTILLPAYHCPALVEPFIWNGTQIKFYHLHPDLSVDLEDLASKIDNTTVACLFVRYFGFALNISESTALARSKGLTVIEDWAHCFFGSHTQPQNGLLGDYAISSCNKFFPTYDGGVIHSKEPLKKALSNPTLKQEIKYFLHLNKNIFNLLLKVKGLISSSKKDSEPNISPEQKEFRYFDHSTLNESCFKLTKLIVTHSNHSKIIQARQQNYQYLLQHLSDISTGSPLYSSLPNDTAPYVFPYILNSAKYFNKIRNAGIAIFRWEELAKTDCETSKKYHQRLVQVPCHQSLTQNELDYIINTLKNLDQKQPQGTTE